MEILSYRRITIQFSIIAFTHARWLFCNYIAFLPDARGTFSFKLSASLCIVRPTSRASHRHEGIKPTKRF